MLDKGKEQLVIDNIDLVYYTLNKMNMGCNEDLVSEGLLALVAAANKFDVSKGLKFSTYAVSYIRGYVKTYLNTNAKIVKPKRVNGKYLESVTTSLDCDDMPELEDSDGVDVESLLFVKDFISKLDERERIVVKGLIQERTQAEIASTLNISQCQVYKIIMKIRFKYRKYNPVSLL